MTSIGGPSLPEELAGLAVGEVLERTCAVLLTDVVDSTRLAASIGDAQSARLWAGHDTAARALLRRWYGVEIDRSDGMLLLFGEPAHAIAWAVDYHRALARLEPPMRARTGVHVGPVMIRRNPAADVAVGAKLFEADGLAKPIAARIMALACGSQTLLSHAARSTLAGVLIQSHGHWRLKGIPDPIELFEAVAEDGQWNPPADSEKAHRVVFADGAWTSARKVPNTLPAQRDSFVGRERVLTALWRRFEAGERLVTLAGIGGAGKTRIAMAFGARSLGMFPGGVWFCDLAPARDAAGIVSAVARGLDVTIDKGDAIALVADVIRARGRCLVILDNFEQVHAFANQTLGLWFDGSQAACFLVTSREVLGIPGENLQPIDSLDRAEAIELFRRRACEAAPGAIFADKDEAVLEMLVDVLDGLPLAIELAAARVRVMPPRTLLERMDERFRLLASGNTRGERQSTLRATFDWSWDLLGDAERSALAQLSIFEGGFTVADAEGVLDLAALPDPPWVPDLAQSLLDKSLLRTLPEGRLGLLTSVQDYAGEQLRTPGRFPASGTVAAANAVRRHAAHFASAPQEVVTASGCANIDNAIAACRRTASEGLADFAEGALANAWAALALRGPAATGIDLALSIGAIDALPPRSDCMVKYVLGSAQLALGDIAQAERHLQAALTLAMVTSSVLLQARVLVALGDCAVAQARADEAMPRYVLAAGLARQASDLALECEAVKGMGNVHYLKAEATPARERYKEALAIAKRAGAGLLECAIRSNLGNLAMGQGELATAQAQFEAALPLARDSARRMVEGNTLCNLGWLAHLRGNQEQSIRFSEAALEVAVHLGNPRLESIVLCNLAIADEAAGQIARAQGRFEAALALVRRLGEARYEAQFLTYLGLLHLRQQHYEAAQACLTHAEELLRGTSDRMSLGVTLCAQSQLQHKLRDSGAAQTALAEAESLAEELGALADSELALAVGRTRAALGA